MPFEQLTKISIDNFNHVHIYTETHNYKCIYFERNKGLKFVHSTHPLIYMMIVSENHWTLTREHQIHEYKST